jgi:limonene-1,2-epoxide hydrolase
VLAYTETMEQLVPSITGEADWAPLAAFVAVDDFQRVGTFLEVHDWSQYVAMLTQWASSIDRFETTVHRITESRALVFYEIEERHFHGDHVNVVNSMTVFEFDDAEKIHHLDVYLQQAR